MFMRFTVDAIAEQLIAGAADGELDGRVIHRFLRKGRWAGRRGHDPVPFRLLLTAAVSVASHHLTLEYVEERNSLRARLGGAEAEIASLDGPVQEAGAIVLTGAEGQSTVTGPALDASFAALSATKTREQQARVAAANAQRASELASARATANAAATKLQTLQGDYRDRARTAHELGKALWARYCDGYDQKAKATAHDERRPAPEIEFEIPESLLGPETLTPVEASSNG